MWDIRATRFSQYLLSALAMGVLSGAFSSHLNAQVTGPNGNGGPETRLNLSGLGGSSTPTVPKGPAERVLLGTVQDKAGAPLKGATVYLKDDRSKKVRSMTADETGAFRFVQLSRTAEYEIWATLSEKKSPIKSVTSFETKDEITRNLKIE
ncbi:MAG: carboxypeptidase-like regulatory domain-containing protein [Janthinobacterium lividum]